MTSPETRATWDGFIRRMHFYVGMFVGPFLLVAALSGALYALAPTMESVYYRDLLKVDEVTHAQPLDDQVHAVKERYPDRSVTQIWPATEPTDSTRVLLSSDKPDGDPLAVFVNPGDKSILGAHPTYSGLGELPLRRWISGLHESLHLGPAGMLYSELAASWLWALALGGVWLWWKRRARLKKTSGRTFSARLGAMRWHSHLGLWLLVAILGLSATGITWSNIAGDNVNAVVAKMGWKAEPINTSIAQPGDSVQSTAPATPHEDSVAAEIERKTRPAVSVLTTARAEGLTGPLVLRPSSNMNEAWQVSERWVPWRLTSDALAVDPGTGDVVGRQDFKDLPLFSKLSSWGIYLHMGIMFGLPLQLALFAVGIGIAAIVILGYRMWWLRRPARSRVVLAPGPLIFGVVLAATVGVFLPLMGITLALFLAVDVIRALWGRRHRSEARAADRQPEASGRS